MKKNLFMFITIMLVSIILVSCTKVNNDIVDNSQNQITVSSNSYNQEVIPTQNSSQTVPTTELTKPTELKVIISEDQTTPDKGIFKLGMSRDEVLSLLKAMNIEIQQDLSIDLLCKNITFRFNKNKNVTDIFVSDDKNFRTLKGLNVGDNIDKVYELYGKDFKSHQEPEYTIYTYKMKNSYFDVSVGTDNNIVNGWGISMESH